MKKYTLKKNLAIIALCVLCASVAKAQTPVTLSTVNIYGPSANATVTFRPVQQIGIIYPNYVLGDSISVTPTNGLVTTNLLEGPYIISFSGLFASQRVYVPGLWITNMGYTLPLNLASAAWQFPVGTTTVIVTNSGGDGGGGSATNVFFASGTNTSYRVQNGTNVFDVPNGIFDPFGSASNALSGATNLATAALNSAIAFTSSYTNQMTNAVTSAGGVNHISVTATTNSSGIALIITDASQTNATLNNIASQVSTPLNGGGITNLSELAVALAGGLTNAGGNVSLSTTNNASTINGFLPFAYTYGPSEIGHDNPHAAVPFILIDSNFNESFSEAGMFWSPPYAAGYHTVSGQDNIGIGYGALQDIGQSGGSDNIAIGFQSGFQMYQASQSVGIGTLALHAGEYTNSTAVGYGALQGGSEFVPQYGNTGIGYNALGLLASGNYNTALGYNAGSALSASESNDVDIANAGVVGETGIIRLGTPGVQTSTVIAGAITGNGANITNINGTTLTSSNASLTVGLSKNPLTGETNYDLTVTGGNLVPNVLVTNNASAGSGAWTNNSGFRMVSSTMDLTNSSENVSNLNIVQLSIGGFPIIPAATNIVVENTNGVATGLTIWGSSGMTNSIVFGPTFDTRTNTRTGTSETVGGSGIIFGTSNLVATAGYGIISNAAVIYSGTNVWTFYTNGTVFMNGVGVLNANSPVNATNLSGTAAISVQLQNSSLLPPAISGTSSLQPFLLGSAGGQFLGSTAGIGISNGVDLFANALGLTNVQPANIATNSGSGGNVLTLTTVGAAWTPPIAFTNGNANGTAQTNLHFGGVTTFQAFPGFETPTNSFQLSARGTLFNYPVPYLRPTSTNSVIAFDVMPAGSPQDQTSGTTWGDWCNTDLSSNMNGAISTARIAVHSNYAEIGTYSYNGAPNIPFQISAYGVSEMQFKSASLITIGSANNFQFNPGFGGANEIPASSLFDTPLNLNLSLLSSGTRFDIDYLDHSAVYRSALTVSNNIPTGFSTLWLMKSGGNTVVGGGIGSLATNATLVVTATGITNTTGVNYRICGFTGASVTQTNPLTTIGFSRGTITVPTDILLQPNEYLNGSSCAAAGGQSF